MTVDPAPEFVGIAAVERAAASMKALRDAVEEFVSVPRPVLPKYLPQLIFRLVRPFEDLGEGTIIKASIAVRATDASIRTVHEMADRLDELTVAIRAGDVDVSGFFHRWFPKGEFS